MATSYSNRGSFSSSTGLPFTMETLRMANGAISQNGGLIVIGETVATLHREIQGSKVNQVIFKQYSWKL